LQPKAEDPRGVEVFRIVSLLKAPNRFANLLAHFLLDTSRSPEAALKGFNKPLLQHFRLEL
jgi:hypothetical protein